MRPSRSKYLARIADRALQALDSTAANQVLDHL
jgi:hypothetical protein